MNKKIGFIGAGNMGKAMMNGILSSGITSAENIFVYDAYQPVLDQVQQEFGVTLCKNEKELAEKVQIIILAVKPNMILTVLDDIKERISKDDIVVSIAAGVTIEKLSAHLLAETKIVRVMPNTPALVGLGMSSVSLNDFISEQEGEEILSIFRSFGEAEFVAEYLIDAVVGVSGSAPAYVYMFIEALADGAVLAGLSRPLAYKFAAQTVLGSAKMVLETGKHPGELKDMVTSPGGTTIAAVSSLENNGFRGAVIDAVTTAAEKNRTM
ncbi:pyrroline-5-carboxylate reductase [Enterococcus rivorum]|uniref:Pyrroline-5-carboxylate reductase n=1 Tax=Enterococcus rivorum TaxID=762845 RepID=A0A1E5L1L9_9ENTE|nr:pyrroline-5-carboxylate reductase [Enterococcus rivorum]MBP2097780.1 pyrroline-5-carboxylate reductase [Enterococcus rivorum]OEH84042.1 pyrroline-5-carboxylate reductase [Enterococcus rivorum]